MARKKKQTDQEPPAAEETETPANEQPANEQPASNKPARGKKTAVIEQAISEGVDKPKDIIEYCMAKGYEVSQSNIQGVKIKLKKKAGGTTTTRAARNVGDGLIANLEQLKELVDTHGAEQVKKLVDLFARD